MGAIIFFILFVCLVPVALLLENLLDKLGLLGKTEDPVEWDMEEEQKNHHVAA